MIGMQIVEINYMQIIISIVWNYKRDVMEMLGSHRCAQAETSGGWLSAAFACVLHSLLVWSLVATWVKQPGQPVVLQAWPWLSF